MLCACQECSYAYKEQMLIAATCTALRLVTNLLTSPINASCERHYRESQPPSIALRAFLSQDVIDLLQMSREIIHQIVPHLGFVLMLLVAVPRPFGDGELPAALKHKRDRAFGDLHLWRRLG
jgi:hypothetical protein